jgi:hypothetical protein
MDLFDGQTMEKLLSIPSDYWSCYSKYMEAAETPVYKPKRFDLMFMFNCIKE